MAGSYNHVVTDQGNLRSPDSWFIENLGDAYEAVEEMYGMIWWLAGNIDTDPGRLVSDRVEMARLNYKEGLELAKMANRKEPPDGHQSQRTP